MNSSPEPTPEPVAPAHELGPTAQLWSRRVAGTNAVACAAALTGISIDVLSDALSISLAASEEAVALLDGMELRVRTLTTSIDTDTERCIYSVLGPVLWSETITARANALGNEDVFVCATPSRSFDTVENRVLVAALEAIGRAARALRGPMGSKVPPADAVRIGQVAEDARAWRRHHRLADVRSARRNGRDMARLRGGHRMARMAPVIAIRQRVAEPFIDEDLDGLADARTSRYLGFVLETMDALAQRFDGPRQLTYIDGGLWADDASFRHPGAAGETPPGLCYRGIPLLPPVALVEGARWASKLPGDGVRISTAGDLRRLLDRLSAAPPIRRGRDNGASDGSDRMPDDLWSEIGRDGLEPAAPRVQTSS
ncbi:hypothetical protein BH10ACT3_BH10ACT3_14640 [soil metagenome]